MKKTTIFVAMIAIAMIAGACGGSKTPDNKASNANSNSTTKTSASPAGNDLYSAVYALHGPRMPDDAKLGEQKRDFVNALHVSLKRAEGITKMNWEEKFKEPATMKLEDGETVLVITLASPEGGKLDKGEYVATDAADAVDTAAKDKNLAIITLIDSSGAKRLKGKINVSDAGKVIMYSFAEKPAAPKLDALSYGAPFKN